MVSSRNVNEPPKLYIVRECVLTCLMGPSVFDRMEAMIARQNGKPHDPMADAIMNCATLSWF